MKISIFSKMFLFTAVAIILGLNVFPGYSQNDPSKEIMVYFSSGVKRTSPGRNASVTSSLVKRIMAHLNLAQNAIIPAFPNFLEADTLKLTASGKMIKIANMAKIFKIRVPSGIKRQQVIDSLKNVPEVLFADPNGMAAPQVIPNDPYFSYQWPLQPGGGAGRIQAPEAWDIYKGSANSIIGIIDWGIDGTHPDLSGKVAGDPVIDIYHGTHVAGIAAAKTNNSTGVAGVDWNAQLYSKNIETSDDAGIYQKVVDAVNYSSNVNVLNNSWVLINSDYSPRYSTTVRLAFACVYKMDRVAVCANGNYQMLFPNQVYYPAGFGQGIIAVGATDFQGNIKDFSQVNNAIDVSAPGDLILSTYRNGTTFFDHNYEKLSGTSMASPFVSGIASLLKGYNSSLSNDDIEQIIRISADDVNSQKYPGWDQFLGTGRVNARGALDYLRAPYQFQQLTAGPGGTEVSVSSQYISPIYGAAGLPDGNYYVRQHKIERTVSFSHQDDFHIWGRGVATTGWSADPTFSLPWCGVSNVTNTSATLTTYVYEVWQINGLSVGSFIGWFPADVSGVNFAYSTVGKSFPAPSATITGPSVLGFKQDGTWTAHPSGGDGNYSYEWRYRFNGTGSWSGVVGTSSTYTRKMGTTDFELKVTVTSAGQTADATFYVTYSNNPPIAVKDKDLVLIPDHFVLQSNYPNPFNPTTTIRFGLPERSPVKLVIYNIAGQRVATLVNREMSAGYHQVQWNGKNRNGQQTASGVYIYRLTAGKQQFVKKMLLVR